MRRYCFNNQYMNGMRSGIQSGHAAETMWADLVEKYLETNDPDAGRSLHYLVDFAKNHKTWIVLDGHDHETLTDLYNFMNTPNNPYLFAKFHEPGLNNALTSITIVLPERMYDDVATAVGKDLLKAEATNTDVSPETLNNMKNFTLWELEFLKRKAAFHLAD